MFQSSNLKNYTNDKGILVYSKENMNIFGILVFYTNQKKQENIYIFRDTPDKESNLIDITDVKNKEEKYLFYKDLDIYEFRNYYIAANNDRKKIMENVFPTFFYDMSKIDFSVPANAKDLNTY